MSDDGVKFPALLISTALVLWILNALGYLTVSIGGSNKLNIGFTSGLILLLIATWLLLASRKNFSMHDPKDGI
ncbi:hypothetical protein [Thermoplasma acidophilum]|uniref:hypothetical protein n=1 Tax=Thermoplasma acidophilum TaxID=2303 RepID=UPI00064FB5BF|nr:hypothetical protein [Thermoplasma acidophilum]